MKIPILATMDSTFASFEKPLNLQIIQTLFVQETVNNHFLNFNRFRGIVSLYFDVFFCKNCVLDNEATLFSFAFRKIFNF